MVIDFHTHIFPDKIAQKTVEVLGKNCNIPHYGQGTESSLLSSMEKAGVTLSVNLPALTKPEQFESVLNFAISINEKYGQKSGILSFAGAHPDLNDVKNKMKSLRESGIKGIKIHPDYQRTFIDDDRYYNLIKHAKDNDLIVVTHSGVDGAFLDEEVKCSPYRAQKLLERLGGYDKFVFAHLGASDMASEVEKYLVGKDVYFDTGYVFNRENIDVIKRICLNHGTDKILFATDSPWHDQKADIQTLKDCGFSQVDLDNILYKNAKKLLGLN